MEILRTVRKGSSSLAALLVACAVGAPAVAELGPETREGPPPVFVSVFGGYSYLRLAESTEEDNGSMLTLFQQEDRGWNLGGSLTAPAIIADFGARLIVDGGSGRSEVSGSTSEADFAGGQLDVFWRNPELGSVDVGFGYGWAAPGASAATTSVRTHSVPASVALFVPDLGLGYVDWRVSSIYEWSEFRQAVGKTRTRRYQIVGTALGYIGDHVAVEAGLAYEKEFGPFEANTIEGVFGFEVLIPSGVRSYSTIEMFGSIGRTQQQVVPDPFNTASQMAYGVGGQITLHFPGAESLRELNRVLR